MPSGPPELHAKWQSDFNATEYLEQRGYYLTHNWLWCKPRHDHKMTEEEYEAICYLCWEWDYGGLMDRSGY